MVISASAIALVKGIIVISKSAALKAALVKFGTYALATKGVAAAVAVGATVATSAGYFVMISSIPKNSVEGFVQIINGVSNNSRADFFDGVYKLTKVYSSTSTLMSDLFDFIDASDCEPEVKVELKNTFSGLRSVIESEVEKKTYVLMKDVENLLAEHGYTVSEYEEKIKNIYENNTYDVYTYTELLGRGGRIYSEISDLNSELCITCADEYDHYLAYCIAGWMKDHLGLACLSSVSQKQLAQDITDQIFAYLRAYNLD